MFVTEIITEREIITHLPQDLKRSTKMQCQYFDFDVFVQTGAGDENDDDMILQENLERFECEEINKPMSNAEHIREILQEIQAELSVIIL